MKKCTLHAMLIVNLTKASAEVGKRLKITLPFQIQIVDEQIDRLWLNHQTFGSGIYFWSFLR